MAQVQDATPLEEELRMYAIRIDSPHRSGFALDGQGGRMFFARHAEARQFRKQLQAHLPDVKLRVVPVLVRITELRPSKKGKR